MYQGTYLEPPNYPGPWGGEMGIVTFSLRIGMGGAASGKKVNPWAIHIHIIHAVGSTTAVLSCLSGPFRVHTTAIPGSKADSIQHTLSYTAVARSVAICSMPICPSLVPWNGSIDPWKSGLHCTRICRGPGFFAMVPADCAAQRCSGGFLRVFCISTRVGASNIQVTGYRR